MNKRNIVLAVLIIAVVSTAFGVTASHYRTKQEDEFFSAAKSEDKNVVAVINGEKIYSHQVEFISASQKLSQQNASGVTDEESEIAIQTDKEILEKLIRDVVVLQEAKKQKLTANYSEAEKYIRSNYEKIMSANDQNTAFLKEYIAELNLTEEEYIKKSSQAYQNSLTRANFYDDFTDKNPLLTEEKVLEEYEKYIERLISESNIEYK